MTNTCSRRAFLGASTLAPLFWSVKGAFAQELIRTPALTIGPYYPDRLPLDLDNDLILINDAVTPAIGQILWVTGRVLDSAGNPVRGATVEIWQADDAGAYIHSASPIRNRDINFQGYGRFETGSDGRYLFRTVYPGIYPGRTRHIHYQIKTPGRGDLVTQLHFQGEPLNASDGVLNGVTNAAQRQSIIRPVEPVPSSAMGERRVHFDIVMGFTPEDAPAGNAPVISPRAGIVNAASAQSGAAPGAWISIYGFRLAPTTRTWAASDFTSARLPVSLDGVSVTINGKDAAVYYISPNQINVQAPADTLSGSAPVVVRTPAGVSAPVNVQLQPMLPAFFRLADDYIAAVDTAGQFLAPAELVPGLATAPVKPRQTILLFGTGFGPTLPEHTPGVIVTEPAPLLHPVRIRVGNAPATVLYAGMTAAGLYQFNIVTPDLPNGDYPVVAEIAGARTSSVARLRIQA